ncbi:MAG: transposase [Verrucomicrobiota bacterium]
MPTFRRKKLPHESPLWVNTDAIYFITICTTTRRQNTLCTKVTSNAIRESVLIRMNNGEWWPHLFLLMPDHVHALISFSPETKMNTSISNWKRWLARNHGISWQHGFFDHRLRTDESFDEKAHYIRMNPVRAGLVDSPHSWPHVWIP